MRALLAPAAGCGLGRAPPATVRPVRVQRRGPRRAEEIRVSETGGGKAAATPMPAGAAQALPVGLSGWRCLPLAAAIIVPDQVGTAWLVQPFTRFERARGLPVPDLSP